MKTPLVIVLVIVAGMLGFLTIYSQQGGGVAVTKAPEVTQGSATAAAGVNVSTEPATAPEPATAKAPAAGEK